MVDRTPELKRHILWYLGRIYIYRVKSIHTRMGRMNHARYTASPWDVIHLLHLFLHLCIVDPWRWVPMVIRDLPEVDGT